MRAPGAIPAPVTRPASIRAALRAGADRDRWGLPLGGFELLDWDDERHGWRPRRGSDALDWPAEDNTLGAVRLLLTSGVDPNPERPNCWAYGSPLEGAYSGMPSGPGAVASGRAVPTRSAPSSRPLRVPTTTEISSLASSYGRTWQRVSRRATVMVAAVDLVVLAQTRRGAAALPE